MARLIIDGNSVYELDEECLERKEKEKKDHSRKGTEQENRSDLFHRKKGP